MSVSTRKYLSQEEDIHITTDGLFGADLETLCGLALWHVPYEDGVDEPVTCATCKAIYQDIKKSRKKIRFS